MLELVIDNRVALTEDKLAEKKITGKLVSFYICISLDYLFTLQDFFHTEEYVHQPPVLSKEYMEVSNEKENNMQQAQWNTDMEIIVENPEIILLEDLCNNKSNCLVLDTFISFKMVSVDDVVNASGLISKLTVYCSNFGDLQKPVEENKKVKYRILQSVDISVNLCFTEGTQKIYVDVTDVVLNMAPIVVRTVIAITSNVGGRIEKTVQEKDSKIDTFGLWRIHPLTETEFWFLKPVVQRMSNTKYQKVKSERSLKQIALLSCDGIYLSLEAGSGKQTMPILITEFTAMTLSANNWSSELNAKGRMNIQMSAFNEHVGGWEPVIEPVENQQTFKLRPWTLDVFFEPVTNHDGHILDPHSKYLYLSSDVPLEITFTPSTIKTLTAMAENFTDAYASQIPIPSEEIDSDQLVFVNLLGEPIKFAAVTDLQIKGNFSNQIANVETNQKVPLISRSFSNLQNSMIRQFSACVRQEISVEVRGLSQKINVSRALPRVFKMTIPNKMDFSFVYETISARGKRSIVVRSTVELINNCSFNVLVSAKHFSETFLTETGKSLYLPLSALYDDGTYIRFTIENCNTHRTFNWLMDKFSTVHFDRHDGYRIFVGIYKEIRNAFCGNSDRKDCSFFKIHVAPILQIRNYLPLSLYIGSAEQSMIKFSKQISSGEKFAFNQFSPQSILVISYGENGKFTASINPFSMLKTLNLISLKDSKKVAGLEIAVRVEKIFGCVNVDMFCPYWILNKTNLSISVRIEDGADSHKISTQYNEPFLLCGKSFEKSQNQARISVNGSDWSQKFSLDAVGNSGCLTCKTPSGAYEVGMDVVISSSGLCKIITLTPFYVIVNRTGFALEIIETSSKTDTKSVSEWKPLNPNGILAFWPSLMYQSRSFMRVRFADTKAESKPFFFDIKHSTLLKINDSRCSCLYAECYITDSKIELSFAEYQTGFAPLMVINHLNEYSFKFSQVDTSEEIVMPPKTFTYYTWYDPIGTRVLQWSCGAYVYPKMTLDEGYGSFTTSEKKRIHWSIFTDLCQLIFIITEDNTCLERTVGIFEQQDGGLILKIRELGISLTDGLHRRELAYISIRSSEPVWFSVTKEKTKYFDSHFTTLMENAYKQYISDKERDIKAVCTVKLENNTEFNLDKMELLDGRSRQITSVKRQHYDGIWACYSWSKSSVRLHLQLFLLQIDNQLENAIFPILFCAITPKNAPAEQAYRPLVELSMIKRITQQSDAIQIKYLKILVQEFGFQIDQGFLTNLFGFFSYRNNVDEGISIADDIVYSSRNLEQIIQDASIARQGSILSFEYCHFSPLKIHLSFSMHSSTVQSSDDLFFNSPTLDFILQTFNIAEVDDVVLELGFYERRNYLTTKSLIMSEISHHYAIQVLKQVYVFVFGLDVLGNPFGLIRGVTEGVESLFYEPFKGAIQGPSEFVDGLAFGVRNLMDGVIGGVSNVFSKITDSVGKGLAQLTFDSDFKSRRLKTRAQQQTVPQSIFQGSKGVVMGVFEGVTGVVTKPIKGAKSGGAEGFVKGLGKGFLGLLARPVGGVVDFASTSFEGVKRLTTLGSTKVRMRLPRFVDYDCLVRPYRAYEAEGNHLLQQVVKEDSKKDVYVAHMLCYRDPKCWLVATNRRLIVFTEIPLLGQFQLQWTLNYEDLTDVPIIKKDSIFFLTREVKTHGISKQKKYGKELHFLNETYAKWICRKISDILYDQEILSRSNL